MKEPTKKPPASGTDVWPEEIRLAKSKSLLDVRFDNGESFSLSAELLRVESPSAEVQGHGPGQKTTPVGKRDIFIMSIEPVGNYAIRIGFSDGHNTGIFSWNTLYDYGLRQDELMTDYLSRLKNDGTTRS
ncbi:DUF971 domain-containing protein [Candidatus Puniceispirillum sp.]|jgi:DUF971 family protein|nr:DUF971 domain-containing protein [Candidatus Puniceispirillum sp.]